MVERLHKTHAHSITSTDTLKLYWLVFFFYCFDQNTLKLMIPEGSPLVQPHRWQQEYVMSPPHMGTEEARARGMPGDQPL